MDIQKLMNAISESARVARKDYHVSLGALTKALRENPDGRVSTDDGRGLGEEHSYRGYYSDLSFEPEGTSSSVAEVLAACERALKNTYEGYKGGDYTYADDTPLWLAPYGCTGPAIVALKVVDGDIYLTTKDME